MFLFFVKHHAMKAQEEDTEFRAFLTLALDWIGKTASHSNSLNPAEGISNTTAQKVNVLHQSGVETRFFSRGAFRLDTDWLS
jgi:hypothetical protein